MRALLVVAVISVTVVIHEYGHAMAMISYGVPVKEFAVGIGPVVWDMTTESGTVVSFRAIPFGGFTEPDAEIMKKLPFWPLLKIFMWGMYLNVLVAFVLLVIVRSALYERPYFFGGSVARLPKFLQPFTSALLDTFIMWLVIPPYIVFMLVVKRRKFFKGIVSPLGMIAGVEDGSGEDDDKGARTESMSETQRPKRKLLSPLVSFMHGFLTYFCMINVSIAGFNLLPLFPLDGGHIVGLMLEMWFGTTVESIYLFLSMWLFILFVISIFVSDIGKIFRRRKKRS